MKKWLGEYGVYLALSLVVFLPLLAPGYILTLDMVFTPVLRLPDSLTNDYPFYLLLHLLDIFLPSELIQKVLLILIIPLAAIGLHRLLIMLNPEKNGSWQLAGYTASILFAVNPYTYSRFMAGQYLVLIGYAILPWFLRLLLEFIRQPGAKLALKLAGLALVVGAISIHTLGLLAVMAASVLIVSLFQKLRQEQRGQLVKYAGLSVGVFLMGSSYWLIPAILGEGNTAHIVNEFDAAHTQAFATVGDNLVSKISNVLRLQGFWLEQRDLYLLPQDRLPGWGTVRLIIWILVVSGAIALWRRSRHLAIILLAIGVVGLLLGIGVGQSSLTAIGYREPHKFAGLVALTFAIFSCYGTVWLVNKASKKSRSWGQAASGFLLLTVIIFTPTMYWGFAGQLSPSQYPKEWFELNDRLNRDTDNFKVIFLPWHQYMSFGFAGRNIANPAERFFDKPVIISNNPELGNIAQPTHDRLVADIARLLAAPQKQDLSESLATYDIKYIILAKEYNYQKYRYLDDLPGMALEWQSGSLKLYRITATEGR